MAVVFPWLMEEERALRGFSVEWVEPGELIAARRNELFRTRRHGPLLRIFGLPADASLEATRQPLAGCAKGTAVHVLQRAEAARWAAVTHIRSHDWHLAKRAVRARHGLGSSSARAAQRVRGRRPW
jgi:hypothetical protein